ncbi:VESICLE TETHERING-LIKE PROTEIN putative-RELATED [Salix koriyanagi]|uniref:VESICLE TETHERING-LIKE PROTEIN putative-RELATED n=1 Tax=Salix koriyanagi TaxID=2511006 RepID=A0A9Q0YU74_9ROSI|nr:VESICLE TETHERING-LIKE PROTEIN putative-RELATED [Salix koriyanagi]
MTRLNRMSMDSDFLVDRGIVIKLLVTFFQRNNSKEVLDLMVRMLGFSDEDKQRIGVAQLGGKGVVRGVLGLPGRLVGGILGGNVADGQTNLASDNQICGLIFYSRKLKKGKRGDLGKKIQVNPIKVCKEGVQMLLGLARQCPTMELAYLELLDQILCSLIPSSQRFL